MVLYFCYSTRRFVHGKCDLCFPEWKELIQITVSQFGGVGVNCHQPFGSKRLTCPYDPRNPSPYQPVLFEGLGDQTYSGDFECEPSDSVQAEADPIPDASQFLSPDQISRIEQLWTYNQDQLLSPAEGNQIASTDSLLPIDESMDDFQLLDPGPSNIFDETISRNQIESNAFLDMTDYISNGGQDISSDESLDDSLFSDTDLFA